MKRHIWPLLLLVLLLSSLAAPALAQAPTPNEINEIAKDLWCPLCNGVRLDNCELQACIQMKEVISQKLEEGAEIDEIKAYFVEQYGDVVLGAPANEGFNRVVWLLPILAAVVGLGWLIFLVRSWVQRRPAPAPTSDSSEDTDAGEKDDYLTRVDEELDRYL
jgi:cytochrome c-type biogenesis protein CcmH